MRGGPEAADEEREAAGRVGLGLDLDQGQGSAFAMKQTHFLEQLQEL